MTNEYITRKSSKEVAAMRNIIEHVESTSSKEMFLSFLDQYCFKGTLTEKQYDCLKPYLIGCEFVLEDFNFNIESTKKASKPRRFSLNLE